MGLKQLLEQGQTTLSAGSFPGDTPINDPQSGFVQQNSPDNTYEDEVIGTPNNGSTLVNTLGSTALDNTQPLFDTSTLPPNTITDYPALTSGEFNGASTQYQTVYSPNNTYLNQVSSPTFEGVQTPALPDSGLTTDTVNAIETTFIVPNPDNITTYPASDVTHNTLSSGLNSAPQQFNQIWNGQNKYWSFFRTNPTVFNPQGTNTTGRTGVLESLINRIVG